MSEHREKFETLLDELERWNRKVNLTAVRDREQMAVLHIQDSLAALGVKTDITIIKTQGDIIRDLQAEPGETFGLLEGRASYQNKGSKSGRLR